jgi:protein TonB
VSARHANKLNRCLVLSLCLHSLLTLGILQYMSTVTPAPDSPTPVSITLTAPVLSPLVPHLEQQLQLRQPTPTITPPRATSLPTALSLVTTTVTTAHASQPTIEPSSPLPHRVPPNRRTPVKRLSAPVDKTSPAIPRDAKKNRQRAEQRATRAAAPTSQPTSPSTGLLNGNRPGQRAAGQITGDQLPQFIYHPKPHYPLIARRRGWQGTVLLNIEMRSDGTIGTIKIATSSGYPPLDAAARQAVRKWRHRPLQRNGIAITRQAILPIHFRLD